jgi:hypothetical protein
VKFEAVKRGGKNFVKVARVSVPVEINIA